MKVGLVCPYSLDVPGGVQNHVKDLATSLRSRGHEVAVLAPGKRRDGQPEYVEVVGRALPVPYNGSVARLAFGPRVAARTRRWLAEQQPDILHVHEPAVPSVSLLAARAARSPVVATFHSAQDRSRALAVASPILRPGLNRLTARIAVSQAARATVVQHLGIDPVVIPNGVFCDAFSGTGNPSNNGGGDDGAARGAAAEVAGPIVVFLGRIDEPRKGLDVALAALPLLVAARPDVTLRVAGRGRPPDLRLLPNAVAERVDLLGEISDEMRGELLRSASAFVAPHRGGESFGLVVVEALAAGAPVVASDLPAFRTVLEDGRLGRLVAPGDPQGLAACLLETLEEPAGRGCRAELAARAVRRYDWATVTDDVTRVYDAVLAGRQDSGREAACPSKRAAKWRRPGSAA